MTHRPSRIATLCLSLTLIQGVHAYQSNNNPSNINHLSFNRIAAELNLPLFWQLGSEGKEELSPEHVHILWGIDKTSINDWISEGEFTSKFYEAYQQIVSVHKNGHNDSDVNQEEQYRRQLIRQELATGMPTLVYSNFTNLSPDEQRMVKHIINAATHIESLFAKQKGAFDYRSQIINQDPSSQMLFYRNQGPWCEAPGVSADPNCNALSDKPTKKSGLYPLSIQNNPDFCEFLALQDNARELLDPFTKVVEQNGKLLASPYHIAYQEDMSIISHELKAAAQEIKDTQEEALKTYLLAASQAFLDNNWLPADEAWAQMNVSNSKWYLRIGPDEVYYEPCSQKAGFHVSFATINQDSKAWQEVLEPLKSEMEQTLADLAGPPYQAREVSFHLPDFVNIVLNAGDSRSPQGATIGQSLPNWGPVANEGRGRTIAMTNFYTDPDSLQNQLNQAQSMLCPESMADYSEDSSPKTMSVVLHEAAHNLGPAHEYEVNGQKATEIFGGPMASMLEELKAQTSALYFTDWLVDKGVIKQSFARQAHNADVLWSFGHISQGMYDSRGGSKPYSQLAAIQLGYFMDQKAITWSPDTLAANGLDKGCFILNQEKLPQAIHNLLIEVAGIKGRGDKQKAESLKQKYVDNSGETHTILQLIANRWLRYPKASFVYSIELK